MSKGVFVALSGAVAQETALDTTASNLANADIPGYQRLRPVFRQALADASQGRSDLRYASVAQTSLDTTPGEIRQTGRSLDVALPRGAYLGVSTANGVRYTRAGALSVDRDGVLRSHGAAVLSSDKSEPIKVRPEVGEVRIEPDGSVRQGDGVVGKLAIVQFERPESLVHEGGGMIGASGAGAPTAANVTIEVGALEGSNTRPLVAMTELMSATRTFEAFQRVIDAFSEADRKLLSSVPSPVE